MMHCRMCSQRLPRPGRLCRECEQELKLARSSAQMLGSLSPPNQQVDEGLATIVATGWAARLPSRPAVIVAALAVGFTVAAALYALNGLPSTGARESVMIDRDLSSVRAQALQRPAEATRSTDMLAKGRGADAAARKPRRESDAPVKTPIAATAATPPVAPGVQAAQKEPVVPAKSHVPAAYDRVLGLADALDGCARESFFARLACEQRARAHFCEGAGGRMPQCAEPPAREYGQ